MANWIDRDVPPEVTEVPSDSERDWSDIADAVRDIQEAFVDIVQPIVETISVSREDDDDDNPAYTVTDTYYDDD